MLPWVVVCPSRAARPEISLHPHNIQSDVRLFLSGAWQGTIEVLPRYFRMRLDMSWQTGRKVTSTSHCLDCVYSSRQDELLDVMAKLGSAKPELYFATLISGTKAAVFGFL
jgi:hypothetical protein